jgi:hypothetical protein
MNTGAEPVFEITIYMCLYASSKLNKHIPSEKWKYYIKCRYEIREEKSNFGMAYRHIPAHFENWMRLTRDNSFAWRGKRSTRSIR